MKSAYFTIYPGENPPSQKAYRLNFFSKYRFHILRFPNSTGLFPKPTGHHYTEYRFFPDIAPSLPPPSPQPNTASLHTMPTHQPATCPHQPHQQEICTFMGALVFLGVHGETTVRYIQPFLAPFVNMFGCDGVKIGGLTSTASVS
jgi:hypothetical protein